MKPAFTKGPWRVEPFIVDGKTVSIQVRGPARDDNARGLILAQTSYASDEAQRICYVETEAQALANARAMAAFPEVLAALVAMVDHHSGVKVAADQRLLDAAEAAIAKVIGVQQ
ncbi:hypothetical protein RA280_14675 [Cupriavidus sp. CV2]|uniref:hypothetical protein n=1 Tax=Cupriavidus ulmosensis TaxID=3065913 RepID=UPI00296B429A|nr:hypothetical protein [Cupriavidus sp. CV2]MDW3682970.1 hypothetical protein [Cupriavidus sp. CV2]